MSLITLKDELQNYLTYENYLDKYLMNVYNIKKHLQIYFLLLIEFPIDLKNNIFKFKKKKNNYRYNNNIQRTSTNASSISDLFLGHNSATTV